MGRETRWAVYLTTAGWLAAPTTKPPDLYSMWWTVPGGEQQAIRCAGVWNRDRDVWRKKLDDRRDETRKRRYRLASWPSPDAKVRESPLSGHREASPQGASDARNPTDPARSGARNVRRAVVGNGGPHLADRPSGGGRPMSLSGVLAKAQAEFKALRFDSSAQLGAGRTYRYASLAALLEVVKPVLSKHGVAVLQFPEQSDGVVSVTTQLVMGEEKVECRLSAPLSRGGFHELGSAITYLRRYGLSSLLGLAGEEDEDGHAAEGSKTPPQRRQSAKAASSPKADDPQPPATEVHSGVLHDVKETPTSNGRTRWGLVLDSGFTCGTFDAKYGEWATANKGKAVELHCKPRAFQNKTFYDLEKAGTVTPSGKFVDAIPF